MRRPRDERGSVTVLTAGAMVLALVLVLVAVDLGRTVGALARAQTAADAAALAAAQQMAAPSGPATPEDAAAGYAERNGAMLRSCSCPAWGAEALTEVEVPVDLLFLGGERTVRRRARAVVGGGA